MPFLSILRRFLFAASVLMTCGTLQAYTLGLSEGGPSLGFASRKATVFTQREGRTFVTVSGNEKASVDQSKDTNLTNAYLNGMYSGGTLDTWIVPP